MNPQLKEVEVALTSVHESLHGAKFDSCDQSDVEELIERVEQELEHHVPNAQVIGTFLNSIARSLRSQPNTREACTRIDEALRKVGVAPTWMN
ncbi:MAG: hypothetical protein ABW034_18865 [Steroidobacteraceae bacterium]